MDGFLLLAFTFLIAGVIAVPLATRFGLGSVLGYLIAGIAISPILRILGVDIISLQHFAEFGVVMMLFLVGLELEPKLLWNMRNRLLGLGGLQVSVTALAIMGVALLFGQPWTIALAIGLVLCLSSTAIVLQTLNEKGLMRSDGGQASFSVLLFQDIAVIPMLALIPLLAMPDLMDTATTAVGHGAEAVHSATESGHAETGDDGHGADTPDGDAHAGEGDHGPNINVVDTLPGWLRALVTFAAIGGVVIGGHYLTRPIFRFIAGAGLRELFTAAALMLVIGIALLMTVVGLSPALGTFLAGVVLANSEYRHELESDIGPFKGLLLGLFFMTVGAGIDFGLLAENALVVVGLTLGLILLKATVLFVLGIVFKVPGADRWLFALGLAQAGEFGFVLLSFTVANDVIPRSVANLLLLVVALSMLLTPVLFILFDRVIAPKFSGDEAREADKIDEKSRVIIAGHGRFGGVVNRILLTSGVRAVVLDHSSAQLEMLRTFGVEVYFGDASRPDLLHSAGIAEADLLVVAVDDPEQATEIVRHVSATYPGVHIVARAMSRFHVYELYAAGARDIIRDVFDSSVRAGRSTLEALGVHPYEAERRTRAFGVKDRQLLREMASVYDPSIPAHKNQAYVEQVRGRRDELEAELQDFMESGAIRDDNAWLPPNMHDVEAVTAERRKSDERD